MKRFLCLIGTIFVIASGLFADDWNLTNIVVDGDLTVSQTLAPDEYKGNQLIGVSAHGLAYWNKYAGISLGGSLNVCIMDFETDCDRRSDPDDQFLAVDLNAAVVFRLINWKNLEWSIGPGISILLAASDEGANNAWLCGPAIQSLMLFKINDEIGVSFRIDGGYYPFYVKNAITYRFQDTGICNLFFINPQLGVFLRF